MSETVADNQLTPEQIQQMQMAALIENQGLMAQVVREMKEVPELPSEVPTDTHALIKVEFPDEGGVLTYMEGYELPFKGFPFHEFVDKIDTLKKVSRGALSSLFHSIKNRSKWQIALLILVPWVFTALAKGALYASHRVIMRFKIKELRYSTAMRELYRAMSKQYFSETQEEREVREMIRDVLCMVLENDNAYRFRFQDIVPELDKVALRKNPSKELTRLFTLMQSREVGQDLKDTWTLLKKFVPMYLLVNGKVRKGLVEVLCELDMEKVKLSEEDVFFSKPRKDYKFSFMQNVSN